VPDVLADDLAVLLVGVNPSLASGWAGLHFAHPGNRLWTVLHQAGLTPRRLRPDETDALLASGVGITNLVDRATARASEVGPDELRAGRGRLERLVSRCRPRRVAVLGLQAFRAAFEAPRASTGRAERHVAGRPAWVLPNPSGLNAGWSTPRLVDAYRALRDEPDRGMPGWTGA
jgi:TDG/mug DNA glycosylase family protein